ncbi:MAG: Hsp20/alpha crystallin family protein, partial [Phycisphaerales bacterium]
ENDAELAVEAELPGFTNENVQVTFVGRDLTIQGERPIATPEGAKAIHRERRAHRFTRTLRIGLPVDAERVSAVLRNGLLTVTLPKTAVAQPRRIAVETPAN